MTIDNPFATSQILLRARFYTLLPALSNEELRADVVFALQTKGKLLSPEALLEEGAKERPPRPAGTWALLTFAVTRSVGTDVNEDNATMGAVAVECLLRALDLLDDIEDDDPSVVVETLGVSRALNVSTALLFLALQALLSLQHTRGCGQEGSQLALSVVINGVLSAISGQHRDILSEWRPTANYSTETCLSIAEEKAGSLMSLACRLGALLAGAPPEVCEQFTTLGMNLGVAHQLDNDAHDVSAAYEASLHAGTVTTVATKSDLRRNRKTLPVILAVEQGIDLQTSEEHADEEKQRGREAVLHEATVTTWSIGLLYRERARQCLLDIEAKQVLLPELHLLLDLK